MGRARRFFLRLIALFRVNRAESDLAREVASHLALMEDEFRRKGMTPDDARLAARRAFGGVEQAKEQQRDARSFTWLEDARRDVRYAVRELARDPGFTIVVVLTLALGIGATTSIFSVVHAVLLNPLPFDRADQLVQIYEHVPARESPDGKPRRMSEILVSDFRNIIRRSHSLSAASANSYALVTIADGRDADRLALASVSASMFSMLRQQPMLGRAFTVADEQPGNNRVVILSYGLWRQHFGGDPNVLGTRLRFNGSRFSFGIALGADYTVVGVMAPTFHFPNDKDQLWTPLVLPVDNRPRRTPVVARLADGASIQDATLELDAIARDRPGSNPTDSQSANAQRFELVRVQDEVGGAVKSELIVLSVAVAFVLLIACANVGAVLLARDTGRQREIAIRVAIGAGRGRLVRQMLAESLVLAALGGLAGILLASGGLSTFRALATSLPRVDLELSATFPRLDAIGLDQSVLLFAAAVSLATGFLFGLAPAFSRSRVVAPALASTPSLTGQRVLVVAQVAVAILLCVGGVMLTESVVKLAHVEPGYDPTHVLTFQVALPGPLKPLAQQRVFAEEFVSRLHVISGVQAASYANQLPMVSLRDTAGGFKRVCDRSTARSQDGPDARFVSHEYFQTMNIRVIAGRGLAEADRADAPRALVINQELARRDFPGENPVGRTACIGSDPVSWQIVGVVNDVHQFGLGHAPEPQFFADVRQVPQTGVIFPVGAYFAVRAVGDPALLVPGVRDLARQFDAQATVESVATMDQLVTNSMVRPRLNAVLVGIFAALALVLASAGIYGLMSYTVAQRTREIGIRMALGAGRVQVLTTVLGESAMLTIGGIVAGLVGAAMVTRYLQSLLFGVSPLDAVSFIVAAIIFAATSALAALYPARRATKVDPMIALRCE